MTLWSSHWNIRVYRRYEGEWHALEVNSHCVVLLTDWTQCWRLGNDLMTEIRYKDMEGDTPELSAMSEIKSKRAQSPHLRKSAQVNKWASRVTNITRNAPILYRAKALSWNKVISTHFKSEFHFLRGRRAVTKKQGITRSIPIKRAVYRTIPANPTSPSNLFRKNGNITPPTQAISFTQVIAVTKVNSYRDYYRQQLFPTQVHDDVGTIDQHK